jgi:magnesium-transporting ATPase (P-type)
MKEIHSDPDSASSAASTANEKHESCARPQPALQDLPDDDDEPPIRRSTHYHCQKQHQHPLQDAAWVVVGGDPLLVPTIEKRPFDRAPADLARDLHSSLNAGLDESLVQTRLRLYGKNLLKGQGKVTIWAVLWRQVSNAMTAILLGALAIAFATRDFAEGGVIAGI